MIKPEDFRHKETERWYDDIQCVNYDRYYFAVLGESRKTIIDYVGDQSMLDIVEVMICKAIDMPEEIAEGDGGFDNWITVQKLYLFNYEWEIIPKNQNLWLELVQSLDSVIKENEAKRRN